MPTNSPRAAPSRPGRPTCGGTIRSGVGLPRAAPTSARSGSSPTPASIHVGPKCSSRERLPLPQQLVVHTGSASSRRVQRRTEPVTLGLPPTAQQCSPTAISRATTVIVHAVPITRCAACRRYSAVPPLLRSHRGHPLWQNLPGRKPAQTVSGFRGQPHRRIAGGGRLSGGSFWLCSRGVRRFVGLSTA